MSSAHRLARGAGWPRRESSAAESWSRSHAHKRFAALLKNRRPLFSSLRNNIVNSSTILPSGPGSLENNVHSGTSPQPRMLANPHRSASLARPWAATHSSHCHQDRAVWRDVRGTMQERGFRVRKKAEVDPNCRV